MLLNTCTSGRYQSPRVHAQGVKQSVLSVVCLLLSRKSPDLEFYASMHAVTTTQLVDIGEKLASVLFKLLNMAH